VVLEYVLKAKVEGVEVPVRVKGDWTPGRPPPPCSNPDSPAFSDDGDPPDLKIEFIRREDTGEDLTDKLPDEEVEVLLDLFFDATDKDPKAWPDEPELGNPEWIPEYDDDSDLRDDEE
jgi:hypothetical protein